MPVTVTALLEEILQRTARLQPLRATSGHKKTLGLRVLCPVVKVGMHSVLRLHYTSSLRKRQFWPPQPRASRLSGFGLTELECNWIPAFKSLFSDFQKILILNSISVLVSQPF